MKIGVPKETKTHEYRVGLTPGSVNTLTLRGHQVFVEKGAGLGVGFSDSDYLHAGAKVIVDTAEIFKTSELIIKVKEPQLSECSLMQPKQVLFTFLHLAADRYIADALASSGCVGIAYETVTDLSGALPILTPMSEVAGRVAVQAGAYWLERPQGGSGVLLGGVPGVVPGEVLVIGGGIVGSNAVQMALGLGAKVTVLDRNVARLRELQNQWGAALTCLVSNSSNLRTQLERADLVVGAVLVPGARAPKIITRNMLKHMKRRSLIVDVAIDQGGCVETSRPTSHDAPCFEEEGVMHYCVTNMPAAVARSATEALNNATLPYISAIADKGYKKALLDDPGLLQGLNVCRGKFTHAVVAESLQQSYCKPEKAL